MSASQKVNAMSASTAYKTSTSFYNTNHPNVAKPMLSSAMFKASAAHLDETLRDIKRRYEDEAKHVQQNYELDYNNHLNLVKTVEELEILLEEERRRNFELETKYNGAVIELDKEKRLRIDYEQEITVLKEELRRADIINSESELKIARLNQDIAHLDSENKALRVELHRLTDLYNARVRDTEERYLIQVRDLTSEIEKLRLNLDQQRSEYESRLRDLDREGGIRYAKLDEKLRDRERTIAELEAELRKMADHISHLKIQYEEEIRRQIALVREDEQHRYHIALKTLEGKMQQVQDERDLLIRKNQELIRDVHLRERQIQDIRIQFEAEAARLKNDINELRNQVSLLNSTGDKLRNELNARDSTIHRLESEVGNLEREQQRLKDIHTQELNRLLNDQNNERRRWDEAERVLQAKISELERIIRSLESENSKLRTDLEKLKEQITGNVHRTIFQTFVDYDSQGKNSTKAMY